MKKVLEKITKQRELRGWSEYQLSEKSGLPQSTISSWYRKNMLPTLPSLEKLCTAFGISMSQFFAEINDPIYLTTQQKEMFDQWNKMSKEQKDTLLQFIKTI